MLPGTRQVTVGGAIGADIHGKNHHTKGSFGNHVLSIDLVTADGSVRTLTPDGPDAELFWATVGGMGLTGVIVRATVRLHRTESAYFVVDTDRTADLDELLALLTDGSDDTLRLLRRLVRHHHDRRQARPGGAHPRLARHASTSCRPKLRRDPLRFDAPQLLTFPDVFPNGLANRFTLRAFSELWYRKAPQAPARRDPEHHGLLPRARPVRGLEPGVRLARVPAVPVRRAVRRGGRRSGGSSSGSPRSPHASGLNVLKRFGEGNAAPLSFPQPGWTITVDFPIAPRPAPASATELDELVLDAGGRLYLAKESRTDRGDDPPRLPAVRRVAQGARRRRPRPGSSTSDMAQAGWS